MELKLYQEKQTGQKYISLGLATVYGIDGLSTGTIFVFHPENQPHDLLAMELKDFRKVFEKCKGK